MILPANIFELRSTFLLPPDICRGLYLAQSSTCTTSSPTAATATGNAVRPTTSCREATVWAACRAVVARSGDTMPIYRLALRTLWGAKTLDAIAFFEARSAHQVNSGTARMNEQIVHAPFLRARQSKSRHGQHKLQPGVVHISCSDDIP